MGEMAVTIVFFAIFCYNRYDPPRPYRHKEAPDMINETAVRCFLTLCDTLSFTETAKRM